MICSGVKVDEYCISAFNEFKMEKKMAFIVFGFTDNFVKIEVKHQEPKSPGPPESNEHWNVLVDTLMKSVVAYAVTLINYLIDNRWQSEIVFISWAPDTAPVKEKMLISSSSSTIRSCFVGVRTFIQANSKADLELSTLVTDRLKGSLPEN